MPQAKAHTATGKSFNLGGLSIAQVEVTPEHLRIGRLYARYMRGDISLDEYRRLRAGA